jgi:type IV pilus assembly protein PilW
MLIRPLHSRRSQGGLSLVEMMVGVAIGLLVVAAASLMVSSQLVENRRLMLETQVQQDLRAAMDIVTRELRRAGNYDYTLWSSKPIAAYRGGPDPNCNRYNVIVPNDASPAGEVDYRYYRSGNANGASGFRISGNVLQFATSSGGPPTDCNQAPAPLSSAFQPLTDSKVLKVTNFVVTLQKGPDIQLPCPKLCTGGGQACWPTLTVRQFNVAIDAEALSDSTVKRHLESTVKLRNDLVQFNGTNANQACPA